MAFWNTSLLFLGLLTAGVALTTGCVVDDYDGTSSETGSFTQGDSSSSGISISGKLQLEADPRDREISELAGGQVATVNEQGKVYRGDIQEDGTFRVELPQSEAGNPMVVVVLGPDSRPLGPVVFAARDHTGYISLKTSRAINLGTVKVPTDLSLGRIDQGEDSDVGDNEVTTTAMARLNANGVPVGQLNFGKGPEAIAPGLSLHALDLDLDGMPDVFDADDDGNGIVDDFEPGAASWKVPEGSTYRPHFFVDLTVPLERSAVYYEDDKDALIDTRSRTAAPRRSRGWSTTASAVFRGCTRTAARRRCSGSIRGIPVCREHSPRRCFLIPARIS